MAETFKVKFLKQEYENKITQFNGHLTNLGRHLEKLESLRAEVPNFWDDKRTLEMMQQLILEEQAVRNAMDRLTKLIQDYKQIIGRADRSDAATNDALGQAKTLLGGLGIKQ